MRTLKLTLIALILTFGSIHSGTAEAAPSIIADIKFYVELFYYGDQPENLHNMQSIEEIIAALDEYSHYMTPAEYKAYKQGNNLTVAASTASSEQPQQAPTVTSALLYGDIGYIKIDQFTHDLAQEVAKHWSELNKKGLNDLIIDLRYNGGGYVESAEQLLGFFQKTPKAYTLTTREKEQHIRPVPVTPKFTKKPYILVNRYSASASEMVAISLKDQNAATIVGNQTKGKGTVQTLFEFKDGGALKLTTGKFTGPAGTEVHKIGITPDIQTASDKELTTIHHQLLTKQLTDSHTYHENIVHTASDKTIHLQLPYKMNFLSPNPSNTVQLIQLGNKRVNTTIEQPQNRQLLFITPDKFAPDNDYIVIIEPTIKRLNGIRQKTNMYLTITDDNRRH